MKDRFQSILLLAIGFGFLALLVAAQPERALRGHNDFTQLYAAAQLAGTPQLYSREANLAQILTTHGFNMETVVYTRPPFYAQLLRPFALLPYQWAYALYTLLNLAAVLWFVNHFRRECPSLPVLAAMSFPFVVGLCSGQDTGLVLGFLGCGLVLWRRGQHFPAGLVWSLLAIKFHLFLFLPLALVLLRQWRALAGGLVGGVCLMVLGGWQPLLDYIAVLRDPWIHYSALHMPNLHGLAAILSGGWWLEAILVSLLGGAFFYFARNTAEPSLVLAAALVAGVLVSYHSGIADDVVLYPAYVLLLPYTQSRLLHALAALSLTPIPFALVMIGPPYTALLPLLLLALLAVLVYEQLRRRLGQAAPMQAMIEA